MTRIGPGQWNADVELLLDGVNPVDGRNPAPPKKTRPNKQWFLIVSKWCRILSIHSRTALQHTAAIWDVSGDMREDVQHGVGRVSDPLMLLDIWNLEASMCPLTRLPTPQKVGFADSKSTWPALQAKLAEFVLEVWLF